MKVIFPSGTVDYNIINVGHRTLIMGVEDLIHKSLEGNGSSMEGEKRGLKLEMPKNGGESSFLLQGRG